MGRMLLPYEVLATVLGEAYAEVIAVFSIGYRADACLYWVSTSGLVLRSAPLQISVDKDSHES
jgi:hypothetical protein